MAFLISLLAGLAAGAETAAALLGCTAGITHACRAPVSSYSISAERHEHPSLTRYCRQPATVAFTAAVSPSTLIRIVCKAILCSSLVYLISARRLLAARAGSPIPPFVWMAAVLTPLAYELKYEWMARARPPHKFTAS